IAGAAIIAAARIEGTTSRRMRARRSGYCGAQVSYHPAMRTAVAAYLNAPSRKAAVVVLALLLVGSFRLSAAGFQLSASGFRLSASGFSLSGFGSHTPRPHLHIPS